MVVTLQRRYDPVAEGGRVRVHGSEFGSVGDGEINGAVREAIQGSRCDLLLV